MPKIYLGIFDGFMSIERDKLTSETKIGGTATYFPVLTDLQKSLIKEWTTCGVCGKSMCLLQQAFCPLPDNTSVHHRMIYVFCCNTSACARQPSSSWCAFTLQVDALDDQALNDNEAEEVLQMDPLRKDELPPNCLPPCYVAIVPEPDKEIIVPTNIESEMIRVAEENARHPEVTQEDVKELEQMVDLKDKPSDYDFEKFRKRIARESNQVLRYYERENIQNVPDTVSSLPIFMNSRKVKDILRVPPCNGCGAMLVHELQIIPTCLYFMRVQDYTSTGGSGGNEGVDFGTATVFVCSRCCSKDAKGVILHKEFLFVEKAPELGDEIEEGGGKCNLRSLVTEM